MAMNGLSRRGERLWMLRATISLPVPDSPVMATLALAGATFSISSNTRRIALEAPMKSVAPICFSLRRSTCTSRRVSFFSRARSMQTLSRAGSTGFSMKS